MKHLRLLSALMLLVLATVAQGQTLIPTLQIKEPGNPAKTYNLTRQGDLLRASAPLPVQLNLTETTDGSDKVVTLKIKASRRAYFHLNLTAKTAFSSNQSDFYLPGFWYHKNLRSPKGAPSFNESKSWNVREDRLSTPLTSVFDPQQKQGLVVLRQTDKSQDCVMQFTSGEVILPGKTSVGYVGFDGSTKDVKLSFGYPYEETPKRYIRKLTLIDPITTFAKLEAGEEKTLSWRLHSVSAADYGEFVAKVWQYSFDTMTPQPLTPLYTPEKVKEQLAGYFRQSFVDRYPLKYNSGISLRVADCEPMAEVQLGFCGRVLLNAFNEMEYGETKGDKQLVEMGNAIFDSWLEHGFSPKGWFVDAIHFDRQSLDQLDYVHSIRQQSEGIYAALLYLNYEKKQGRRHLQWEKRIRQILDNLILLLKDDGHFARKYNDEGKDIDSSGGSTPSATSALVMGYKYFKNKKYLQAAKRTVDYVEQNIIDKSDYFSSTLDANCEDKEAAIAAVTSTYYLAMVTKGKEQQHYINLCCRAAYFAMSWYYTWDVPFAQGQMLGDLGFKSRGWGNVSVENNHIDVFIFELGHIAQWLSTKTDEPRFARMYNVIYSSMNQLLPTPTHLCGVGKPGFYPEVVQHTAWDYGRNGKGFYNDIFAPGWTVASLWELYSPTRTVDFLTGK